MSAGRKEPGRAMNTRPLRHLATTEACARWRNASQSGGGGGIVMPIHDIEELLNWPCDTERPLIWWVARITVDSMSVGGGRKWQQRFNTSGLLATPDFLNRAISGQLALRLCARKDKDH